MMRRWRRKKLPRLKSIEEVVTTLQQASQYPLDRIDLSARKLKLLPEEFENIQGLLVLNLYNNQLRVGSIGAFPTHMGQQSSSDVPKKRDEESIDIKGTKNETGFSCSSLWFGNPPIWTSKFKLWGNCTTRNKDSS
ncbi:predicted protein [Arabidopsis lyrata subsp. lyrata]|uniref:Predicted protein n=1 Tax=Arabidopsis lyrata subsp. lyrata TaxID=81972 RepID=D7MAC9_ARALL|nr:predicted protein [Arabidopsis lyrata subsp. lyrata]